jgi:hypothetical protein
MYTQATGPGRVKFVVEEGDSVVFTNIHGKVISGPYPAPQPRDVITVDWYRPYVASWCWGILNPDGTLAFQSAVCGSLFRGDHITLDLELPGDYLLPEDRVWLKRVAKPIL